MRAFYVYILANKPRGTIYVGMTGDIERRLVQHRASAVDSFTRRYAVHQLVHLETFGDVVEAKAREARLKKWPRAWKVALIESANPEWRDLAGA